MPNDIKNPSKIPDQNHSPTIFDMIIGVSGYQINMIKSYNTHYYAQQYDFVPQQLQLYTSNFTMSCTKTFFLLVIKKVQLVNQKFCLKEKLIPSTFIHQILSHNKIWGFFICPRVIYSSFSCRPHTNTNKRL